MRLSQNPWGCLKFHVDLFKNEKTEKYELSAFQNFKHYQNRPNNVEERCDQSRLTVSWDSVWDCLKIHVDLFKIRKMKNLNPQLFRTSKIIKKLLVMMKLGAFEVRQFKR